MPYATILSIPYQQVLKLYKLLLHQPLVVHNNLREKHMCIQAMQRNAQEAKLEKQARIPHRFDRHKLTLEQGVTALRTRRREEGAIMCVVDHQFLMPLTPSSSLQCVELHIIFIVLQK